MSPPAPKGQRSEPEGRKEPPASAPGGALYGYPWRVVNDAHGEVMARGIHGQYIWIDQPRNVVIAMKAADRDFQDPEVEATNVAMIRAIARNLDQNTGITP